MRPSRENKHKLIEKICKISLQWWSMNQIYIKLLYVIYICLGGSLQLLFPLPKKLLNFLGTTPQARPLKNQLWCYTWRRWTAEAPDPPNMKEMSYGSFLASVLIFPLCLHSKQKITCQVPRKLLEAEIKNNLITRLRVHPWSSTAHPRKVIIPKRKNTCLPSITFSVLNRQTIGISSAYWPFWIRWNMFDQQSGRFWERDGALEQSRETFVSGG